MFGSLMSLGISIWTRNTSWEGFSTAVQGWTKELLLTQNPETLIYWQHSKWYGMYKLEIKMKITWLSCQLLLMWIEMPDIRAYCIITMTKFKV